MPVIRLLLPICKGFTFASLIAQIAVTILGLVLTLLVTVDDSLAVEQDGEEIVIIRGFGGHWLRADAFQEKLEKRGFRATIIWSHQRSTFSRDLINDIQAGRRRIPVAIVGYSLGATNAQTMAREFGRAGLRVPVLILLDGPTLLEIPSNVGICLHYYRPNLLERVLPTSAVGIRLLSIEGRLKIAQRGMQLQAVDDDNTQIYNVQLNNRGDLAGYKIFDSHATLPGNENLQQTMVAEIYRFHANAIHNELLKTYDDFGPTDERSSDFSPSSLIR
jgi:pimeloyl-ACP methyl ester carboxylesterase